MGYKCSMSKEWSAAWFLMGTLFGIVLSLFLVSVTGTKDAEKQKAFTDLCVKEGRPSHECILLWMSRGGCHIKYAPGPGPV